MSFGEAISPLLGRFILSWFFLATAYRYATGWAGMVSIFAIEGIPVPAIVLFIAILALTLGGFSLLFGFRTRNGALMLFAYMMIHTLVFSDFWNISDLAARHETYEIFARNAAIIGGLLVLMGMGGGKFAMDNVKQGGRR